MRTLGCAWVNVMATALLLAACSSNGGTTADAGGSPTVDSGAPPKADGSSAPGDGGGGGDAGPTPSTAMQLQTNPVALGAVTSMTESGGVFTKGKTSVYGAFRYASKELRGKFRQLGAYCVAYENVTKWSSDPEAQVKKFTVKAKQSGYQLSASLVADNYQLKAEKASNQPEAVPFAPDDEVTVEAQLQSGQPVTKVFAGPAQPVLSDMKALFPDGLNGFKTKFRVTAAALGAKGLVVSNVFTTGGVSGISCARRAADLQQDGDGYTGQFLPNEAIAELTQKGFSEKTAGGANLLVGNAEVARFEATHIADALIVYFLGGPGCGASTVGGPLSGSSGVGSGPVLLLGTLLAFGAFRRRARRRASAGRRSEPSPR
ncbi:MAG: hypothetical protein IT371_26590 [Deltaproteobacteria bacterium]|nr:hypothetical protein [Deltaproteobacteria bacterium]